MKTEPGISGSPILSPDLKYIIGLHQSFIKSLDCLVGVALRKEMFEDFQ